MRLGRKKKIKMYKVLQRALSHYLITISILVPICSPRKKTQTQISVMEVEMYEKAGNAEVTAKTIYK